MSELAAADLGMLADLVHGEMVLTFTHDAGSGSLMRSYGSTSCPAPGRPPAEATAEEAHDRRATTSLLHRAADANGSGFVSTAEAAETRRAFELLLMLRALPPDVRSDDARVLPLLGYRQSELDDLRDRARRLRAVAGDARLGRFLSDDP